MQNIYIHTQTSKIPYPRRGLKNTKYGTSTGGLFPRPVAHQKNDPLKNQGMILNQIPTPSKSAKSVHFKNTKKHYSHSCLRIYPHTASRSTKMHIFHKNMKQNCARSAEGVKKVQILTPKKHPKIDLLLFAFKNTPFFQTPPTCS